MDLRTRYLSGKDAIFSGGRRRSSYASLRRTGNTRFRRSKEDLSSSDEDSSSSDEESSSGDEDSSSSDEESSSGDEDSSSSDEESSNYDGDLSSCNESSEESEGSSSDGEREQRSKTQELDNVLRKIEREMKAIARERKLLERLKSGEKERRKRTKHSHQASENRAVRKKDCAKMPLSMCQVCKTPNITFDNCLVCAPIRQQLGNGVAGAQNRQLPPANN